MKKMKCIAAAVVAAAMLSGCALLPGNLTQEDAPLPAISSAASQAGKTACTAVTQRNDYQGLPSDQCRRMYDKLAECAQSITGAKDENGYLIRTANLITAKLTDEETKRTVMAFLNDNPQIFWVSNQYTYTFTLTGTSIQLYSRISSSERDTMQKKLNSTVSKILSGVSGRQAGLEREERIFTALADRCTYDKEASADSQQKSWQPYTAYGALVEGKAVCDGYARAMQLLCSGAGLPCRLVNGDSKGAAHIWNLICINGKWYHFDATWMDSSIRNYDYFNVTDAIIKKDHTLSPVDGDASDCNFPLPAAQSTADNYYQKCAVQISALDSDTRKKIAQALVQTAQEKKTVFALHINEKLTFNQTVDKLFNGSPYFFQSCVQYANTDLPEGKRLSYPTMQYSTSAVQGGISIRLAYNG